MGGASVHDEVLIAGGLEDLSVVAGDHHDATVVRWCRWILPCAGRGWLGEHGARLSYQLVHGPVHLGAQTDSGDTGPPGSNALSSAYS